MTPEKSPSAVYEAFDAGSHLAGVVGILDSPGWDNFRHDPDLARRSLTAPGVKAITAVACDTDEALGFASRLRRRLPGAPRPALAVDEGWHHGGVGRGLVEEAFVRVGPGRMDLVASDESLDFYRSFKHREQIGFRMYSDRETD